MRTRTGLVLAGALAIAGTQVSIADAQNWRTVTSSRQAAGEEEVEVNVRYGAGRLRINPAEGNVLYRYELRYDEETMEPEIDWDRGDRTLDLGIESVDGDHFRGDHSEAFANIELNRATPIDLELEFGAGEAVIELGGMSLSRVSISTGASDTDINFSTPNRIRASEISIRAGAADLHVRGLGNAQADAIEFEGGVGSTVLDFQGLSSSAEVSVKMGVGSVVLRIPRSAGVRVNRESFLTGFDAPGLERQGDAYYNANWSDASTRLTVDISAVMGSIDVEWID